MKLKKLRKIYRILFPVKFSEKQIFINELQSNCLIKEFKETNSLFLLNLCNGKQIYLRDYTHSDYSVFTQIFKDEEYKIALSFFKYNRDFKNAVMIDVGANIGYATIYFQEKLKFDHIICIEPSISNFNILKKILN
ncbi:hypothetical protein [Flavobacterium ginsengisoli]|uniref:hypothetical protein n=1 Tax=Flavobacterium ginsengisoli TaxID=871694 RepID=UPI002415596A|nr:hypothetical protein [Flavobacterium ginsengisoli]